jgi:hypothetical protein
MTCSQFGASHTCLTNQRLEEQSAFPSLTAALFMATGDEHKLGLVHYMEKLGDDQMFEGGQGIYH